MATTSDRIDITAYACEPCSTRQNTPVTELVRMVKDGFVVDGKLVGDEWYCCAICFDKKFLCRTRESSDAYLKRTEKARSKEAELNERRRKVATRHERGQVVKFPGKSKAGK